MLISSSFEPVGCFHILAMVNDAGMAICAYIYIFSSLAYIPSNDTVSCNQSYIFYKLFSDIPWPLSECSPSFPDAPVLTCLAASLCSRTWPQWVDFGPWSSLSGRSGNITGRPFIPPSLSPLYFKSGLIGISSRGAFSELLSHTVIAPHVYSSFIALVTILHFI